MTKRRKPLPVAQVSGFVADAAKFRGSVTEVFAIEREEVGSAGSLGGAQVAFRFALTVLDGKWRVPILIELESGPVHFGELRRRLAPVSKKVLNQQLRLMLKDGLLLRAEKQGKRPRVEYSLSLPLGYAALDLLYAIAAWGRSNDPQPGDGCSFRPPLE